MGINATREQEHCLAQIELLCKQALRDDARVDTHRFWMPHEGEKEYRGWISYHNRGNQHDTMHHAPGIPPASLVPEKVRRIAAWIIEQISAKRPEWFHKGS